MNKKIIESLPVMLETIKKVKRDCLSLRGHGDLTEYGQGQLDMALIILGELGLD